MANDKKKTLVPKSSLVIRVVAGMYLMYLAYQLVTGLSSNTAENAPMWVSITAAVVFAICGVIMVFFSGRDFLKGNFQGGIMDDSAKDDSENQ